jgi:hypothetical protein
MPVILNLEQTAEGKWTGNFEDAESGKQIDVQSLSVSGSAISFRFVQPEMPAPLYFSGNYQSWDDGLKGVFTLLGQAISIRFERVVETVDADGQPLGPGEAEAAEAEVPRGFRRHEGHFGLAGHGTYAYPLYILKEDRRNINDITTSSYGWNADVRWFVMDALALFGRYYSGGLAFETNEKNLALFGFTGNEFLEISGFEAGLNVYIGNVLLGDSQFNPYFTFCVGLMDWVLGVDGRGSEAHRILDEPVEGDDYSFGAGIGIEYPLINHLFLEVEWFWRYVRTEDQSRWEDITNEWTNTHLWDLSLGVMLHF